MEEAMSLPDSLGIEVGLDEIEYALRKLWEEAGESKTRASLVNLVIYCEEIGQLEENTRIIREVAAEHACRAILILAEPHASESSSGAWINAHCHPAGKREVCSEQISFHLCGEAARSLPGIVFPHLDSDLPLILWWQATFEGHLREPFWAWVDRLIFDSSLWKNVAAGVSSTRQIADFSGGRMVLGDLNWARLLGARLALASLFDHAASLEEIAMVEKVAVHHGKGQRMAALLLGGWLASRFGWAVKRGATQSLEFVRPNGALIHLAPIESEGPVISRVEFRSGQKRFGIARPEGSAHYELELCDLGVEGAKAIYHAGADKLSELLLSELARGGRHGHYREAVEAVLEVL